MNTENRGIVIFIVFIVPAIGLSLSICCCPEIAWDSFILTYCVPAERSGSTIAVIMITIAGIPYDPLLKTNNPL